MMLKKEVFKGLFILFLLVVLFLSACEKEEKPKVRVSAKLEEEFILDGEKTNLILEVRNIGAIELNGKFTVTPEDSDIVQVNYAGEETFKIISGESIKKSYELTGKTKTYETGVQLNIELIDLNNNSVLYSNDELILYIKRE